MIDGQWSNVHACECVTLRLDGKEKWMRVTERLQSVREISFFFLIQAANPWCRFAVVVNPPVGSAYDAADTSPKFVCFRFPQFVPPIVVAADRIIVSTPSCVGAFGVA